MRYTDFQYFEFLGAGQNLQDLILDECIRIADIVGLPLNIGRGGDS